MRGTRFAMVAALVIASACGGESTQGETAQLPPCPAYCGPDAPQCVDTCGRWIDQVPSSCTPPFEELLACLAADPHLCDDADALFLSCMDAAPS